MIVYRLMYVLDYVRSLRTFVCTYASESREERSENLICWDSCDQLGIYQLYLELISKICGDWSLAGGILSCPIISFISKHVFCNIGILNKTEWEINL